MRFLYFFAVLMLPAAVHAASIQALINPGPLTQSHADLQEECSACHANFDRSAQRGLCLDCHEDIQADINEGIRFHGRSPEVADNQCRTCHTDHEGREHDITGLVAERFNHDLTDFPLTGHHATTSCQSCHEAEKLKRGTPGTCHDCHAEDDAHNQKLGEDCGSCHAPESWQKTTFDHDSASDFALTGAHQDVKCNACHIDNHFKDTPDQCIDCHRTDDVHAGSRGEECGQCHNTRKWEASSFDHAKATGFELLGAHADVECSGCHLQNMSLKNPPETCAGCHSADDVHSGSRGTQCSDCHSTKTWKVAFDHEAETGFALRFAHAELTCEACHGTGEMESLPTNCAACHEQTDPHKATLGECNDCHNESKWTPATGFSHEFTRYPLIGMHDIATCQQCHDSLVFAEVEDDCYQCHKEEDAHEGTFGTACESCHNAGGWELWTFDHDVETTFALTGAHAGLNCAACHSTGAGDAHNQSQKCVACHLPDDIHNGQFGRECERCHTTEQFSDAVKFR